VAVPDALHASPQPRQGSRRLPAVILDAMAAAEAEDTRPRADPLTVTVPFPPSVNNAYVNVTTRKGQSKRVKSERASEFAKSVCEHVRWHLTAINCRPPAPPYSLTLHLYPPIDGRKHDASNLVKLPEDSLMAAIKQDDDDVLEVHVYKHPKDRQPRAVVTLEHVEILEV
jgi:Holliday junction resolvase RusA-like endonuclease